METSHPPAHKTIMRGKNRRMLLFNAVSAATQRNRRPHAAVDAPEERKKPKERKQGKPKWPPFKKTPEIKSHKEEKITAKSGENNPGKSKPPAHFLFLTASKRCRRGWGSRLSGGGLLLLRWKRRVGCALRKWMIRGRRSLMGWAPTRRPRDPEIQRLMRNEEDEEEEEEEEGIELCKKRILMGDKCKALSQSGRLHYDENGVLLPEMIP